MRRAIILIATAVLMVLAMSGVASAASPWDIYNDFAADGVLDGTYTDSELQAYLDSADIDQYGDPAILADLDALVMNLLKGPDRDTFPLTGTELALIVLAGAMLIGGGVALGRMARARK